MKSSDEKYIKRSLGIALFSFCLIIVIIFNSQINIPELIVVNGVVIFIKVVFLLTGAGMLFD